METKHIRLFYGIINEGLMLEQFSNWHYQMPKDPEEILYDFYFFSLIPKDIETRNEKLDFVLKETVKEVTDELQKHMLKALKWALSSELRHLFAETVAGSGETAQLSLKTQEFIEAFEYFYLVRTNAPKGATKRITGVIKGERMAQRLKSYKAVNSALERKEFSNNDFANFAEDMFYNLDWSAGYGGSSWANIAKGYKMLLKAKSISQKIEAIDHTYDLQHNNAPVLEKLKRYYKTDDDEYDWIINALDWKKDVKDIRSYYNKVTPQLKPIVAYVAKNVFGKKGMDSLTDSSLKGKKSEDWEGGIWKGGVWEGGTWEKGIWKDGTWMDGKWKNGTWMDGIWKDGTWMDGKWENGVWENGVWFEGHWKAGVWEKGDWHNGMIWDREYKFYRYSPINPNECKWSLSYKNA